MNSQTLGAFPAESGAEPLTDRPTPVPRPPSPEPRDILNSIGAVVYEWDIVSDRLTWGANVGEVLAGLPTAALATGAALAEMIASDSAVSRFQAIRNSEAVEGDQGTPYRTHYNLVRPDGGTILVEDNGRWFADAGRRPVRAHGILRVAPRGHSLVADTSEFSRRDPLTGALSRVQLVERLNVLSAESTRTHARFAVMVAGIERLSEINRTYGYDIADEVIAVVAQRMQNTIRTTDLMARYSGGKFVLVLDNSDAEQSAIAIRRLLRAISEPVPTSGEPVRAQLRVGAALAPRHGRNPQILLQRAEEAFEFACEAGGERYVVYRPGLTSKEARARAIAISDEIVAALNERRVVLAYQRIQPTSESRQPFHEGLLRIRQADGTLLGPDAVVPTAEKVGLIGQLDNRAFELALRRLATEPTIQISVNASAATMMEPDWVDRVADSLANYPGAAQRLIVEITETVALADSDNAARIFARLRKLGVRIAMDDFGAGHTSFRNLRALGVDIVKIDGAFVQNIARSADDRFFVRTLVDLARHLRIATVAEWVEDSEAMRILVESGIDYLQGFHLGRAELWEPAPVSVPLRVAAL